MERLQLLIDEFCDARDWSQYHTPQALALAIASEVGELCHLYRWSAIDGEPDRKKVLDELGDVLIFSVRMCSVLGMDATEIINRKLTLNDEKYPARG